MNKRDWLRDWSTGEFKTYEWLMTKEWLLAKAHLLALLHTWDDELFEQCGKKKLKSSLSLWTGFYLTREAKIMPGRDWTAEQEETALDPICVKCKEECSFFLQYCPGTEKWACESCNEARRIADEKYAEVHSGVGGKFNERRTD